MVLAISCCDADDRLVGMQFTVVFYSWFDCSLCIIGWLLCLRCAFGWLCVYGFDCLRFCVV